MQTCKAQFDQERKFEPNLQFTDKRPGREKQPQRPRTRPQAQFEEYGNKPEEDSSETMVGRKRTNKKMHFHTG